MNRSPLRWILLALAGSVLFSGCGRRPGEKLYHDALAEWKAGNLVQARTLLEKSIRRRAGSEANADACNRLGVLLWEMGDFPEAVKAFDESCRMKPAQYDVLCNLGVALSAQLDFDAADRAFNEAALLQPDDPRPLAFTAVICAKNRQWDNAMPGLARALERRPDDPALQSAMALAELHTVGATAALQRLQTVTRQHPGYLPALFNIASIQRYWLKNPAEARRGFESYLSKAPADDPFAARARAQLQEINGTGGTGREKVVYTPPRAPNRAEAETNFQKALTYHKKNDLNNAVRWYLKSIEADDTYEQPFYNLGLAYYAVGRLEPAADAFAHAVQINPAYTLARYNSALAEYRLGNTDTARRELEIVLQQQPAYQPAIDLMSRLRK
jgi:superkiller protein 3